MSSIALTETERWTLERIVDINRTSLGERVEYGATADEMDEAIRTVRIYVDLLRAAEAEELPLPVEPAAIRVLESWRVDLLSDIPRELRAREKRRGGDQDYGWSDDLEADERKYAEYVGLLERELEGCESLLNRAQGAPVPA